MEVITILLDIILYYGELVINMVGMFDMEVINEPI